MKNNKIFGLMSFLPAIAYWWLEENYPLRVALGVGLGLAVIEILIERIWLGHVHTISKFNFAIIMILGGLSLLGDDGLWFKLQPCFTGVLVAAFLFWQRARGKSILFEMQQSLGQKGVMPLEITVELEKHMAIFMLGYGLMMAPIAFRASTDTWLFFKTIGFYISSGLFFIFEVFYVRRFITAKNTK